MHFFVANRWRELLCVLYTKKWKSTEWSGNWGEVRVGDGRASDAQLGVCSLSPQNQAERDMRSSKYVSAKKILNVPNSFCSKRIDGVIAPSRESSINKLLLDKSDNNAKSFFVNMKGTRF